MSRVWSGACGCSVLLGLLSGCSSEAPGTFWRIALAGHTVGQERRVDQDDGWSSHRQYSMRLGDEVVAFEASSRWTLSGDDVVAWQSGTTRIDMPQPLPANLFARQMTGEGRVFDPNAKTVRVGQFEVSTDRQAFTDADVHWWVEYEDDEVVAYGADSVRVTRQASASEWQPVDPATVLGLAGAGPLTAHGQLFARLDLEGSVRSLVDHTDGHVEIRRPLWLEIPNGPVDAVSVESGGLAVEIALNVAGLGLRDAVASLVVQVRDRIRYRPTPVADPKAALHGASGDCTEHVALFVDAAVLVGLDAKPVVGWVAQSSGDWVPHAWAVVTIEGVGEVHVDPTLGQRIANPLHLPLATRFQERPWESLGKAVGSSVEIVELR